MIEGKYQAYPDYEKSDIDWVERLPEHWQLSKLRYMFSFGKGLTITKENLIDDGVPCVNYGEVHSKYGFEVNPDIHLLKCVSEQYLKSSPNALLIKGDFVFADTSEDIEGSGNFTQLVSNEDVFAGYHTIIARPIDRQGSRFYAYLLDSIELRTQVRHAVKGVKVFSVTQAILRGISIWLPPIEERITVANFLDHETAKIDTLIEKQQQLIKLLKEKRQAVISHAVTKGLNPDVPMRDSGVEWIGRIPKHWSVAEVRRFTQEHRQGYYSEGGYDQAGHRVVRITDILENNVIDVSESPFFTMDEENRHRYELVKGDFLFQRTGSHKKIGVFSSDEPSVYASFLIRFRFGRKLTHSFILDFFNSKSYQDQLNEQIHGGVNPNIHAENIKVCKFTIPPESEQLAISEHIQKNSKKFDRAILKAESGIGLMQERRTAIISAAVTGKIDVRNWQAPTYESIDKEATA